MDKLHDYCYKCRCEKCNLFEKELANRIRTEEDDNYKLTDILSRSLIKKRE